MGLQGVVGLERERGGICERGEGRREEAGVEGRREEVAVRTEGEERGAGT